MGAAKVDVAKSDAAKKFMDLMFAIEKENSDFDWLGRAEGDAS
jgi:hypothetical protein